MDATTVSAVIAVPSLNRTPCRSVTSKTLSSPTKPHLVARSGW
nr:hypothetical protein [Streptomyces sp. AS02]